MRVTRTRGMRAPERFARGPHAAGWDVVGLTRPGSPLDIKPELTAANVPAEDLFHGIRYIRTLATRRTGCKSSSDVTEPVDATEQQFRALRPLCVVAGSNHLTGLPAMPLAQRQRFPKQ